MVLIEATWRARRWRVVRSLCASVVMVVCLMAAGRTAAVSDSGVVPAARQPWSCWYWPIHNSYNPNLYDNDEALYRYDRFDSGAQAQVWEYNNDGPGQNPEPWWGHCHAWASAACWERQPTSSRVCGGVTFRVRDRKGLCVEAYDESGDGYHYELYVDLPSPGSFWRWLRKEIGGRSPMHGYTMAFIADLHYGEDEIWNHPIYAYSVNANDSPPYSGTIRIWYALDNQPSYADSTSLAYASRTYQFSGVYLSGSDPIDSGTWLGSGSAHRPDSIWRPYRKTSWTTYAQNPHLDQSHMSQILDPIQIPPACTAITPSGTQTLGVKRPTFTWTSATGATWYYIWINDSAGNNYAKKWVEGATAWTPSSNLPAGGYTWWVRAWNSAGYGPWSAARSFTIQSMAPGAATCLSPGGTTRDRSPTFSWSTASPAATWYYVYVNRNGGKYLSRWVETARQITGSGFQAGSYTWWVHTWNTDGYGPWSAPMSFTIPADIPSAIALVAPSSGSVIDNTRVGYQWTGDAYATWYHLYVNKNGANVHSKWYETGVRSGTVTCTLGGHARGSQYAWWVRGWAPDGMGPWSAGWNFSIKSNEPGQPTLVSPTGTTSDHTPSYTWNSAENCEWYHLWVNKGSTKLGEKWVESSTSYTATMNHPNGDYTWWVRGWNSESGAGPWSNPLNFSVGNVGYIALITLTWGSSPADLDSHLVTPTGAHVYYQNKGSSTAAPFAKLDVDDTTSYGPENISLYSLSAGTYKFYVHNYTSRSGGSPYLAGCGARVRVFNASGSVVVDRTVPSSGTGAYWYVFDINGSTGNITVRNTIRSSTP